MYQMSFGDVGRGGNTIGKLRELADEGKLELVITHIPSEHRGQSGYRGVAKTVITWRVPRKKL